MLSKVHNCRAKLANDLLDRFVAENWEAIEKRATDMLLNGAIYQGSTRIDPFDFYAVK